jgi:PhzF family phenazine biosynthesis protein
MQLTMYQVDAFAEHVFKGNPAAVCSLERWLPDTLLLAIAEENNLAETAFFVPMPDQPQAAFHLRWFTPVNEVDLCGHATLASAFVLFEHLGYAEPEIRFHTRSGVLVVSRLANTLRMIFPAAMPQPCATPAALVAGLGLMPRATLAAFDYVAVFDTQEEILSIDPDHFQLKLLDRRGVVATAPGQTADFVSRFFSPKDGIPEDPVTGSAHCELAPYWGERLNRTVLRAEQLSKRGGTLVCELVGDTVVLAGRAAHYMTATITIPDPDSMPAA